MRKIVSAVVVSTVLLWAAPASAHDPIILTAEQRTPADGPLLPDGTVSFALYGTLDAPTDTRGFRVSFAEGDALYISLLIPDLEPENTIVDEDLPYLIVEDPNGTITEFSVDERVPFAEPFTGTNYIRLIEDVGIAVGGTYAVTISGSTPARFTVSVGTKELFGTEVENVPNRELGVGGVMAWYETAPATLPPTTVPMTTMSPSSTSVPSTETAPTNVESSTDEGGVGSAVMVAIVVVSVVGAWMMIRRQRRRG